MVFRWRPNDGPLIVVYGSFSHQLKKRYQSWTPSDKTVWIRAWTCVLDSDHEVKVHIFLLHVYNLILIWNVKLLHLVELEIWLWPIILRWAMERQTNGRTSVYRTVEWACVCVCGGGGGGGGVITWLRPVHSYSCCSVATNSKLLV